jgi:protein phosphatase
VTADELVQYAGRSDVGRLRSSNQDRWGADAEQSLFIVADGVAGSTDGELAAHMVIELLPTHVARHIKTADLDDSASPEPLGRAVAEFSDDLRAYGNTDFRVAGALSTVVAVVVAGSRALVAHLGDSRAYLFRDQRLQRLTRDHTVLQDLIDAGEVDIADAGEHPARATLNRYVAMYPPALPDTAAVDLKAGDRILLCSDGLHGVIDEPALVQVLDSHPVPDDACAALIEAANRAGGPDNITAVVIDIAGTDR